MGRWKDHMMDKLNQFLFPETPSSKQEKEYEEGKKRVYELHLKEKDIFYIDFVEDNKITGEIARGSFEQEDPVSLLDCNGLPLSDARITEVWIKESVKKGMLDENMKVDLKVEWPEHIAPEEVQKKASLLIKKEDVSGMTVQKVAECCEK